jgi:hypothetical protein
MPHELAEELHQLDLLAVQVTDDLRIPVGLEQRELVAKIDFVDFGHQITQRSG